MGTCVFTQQDVEILKFLKTHTLVITSLNDEGVGQIKVHVDVLRDLLKESFTDLEDRAEGILEDIKWARMIHLEWITYDVC